MSEPVYEVVWPLGKSVYEALPLASRDADLNGKTVCELWEWLFRGEEIFPILRELLCDVQRSILCRPRERQPLLGAPVARAMGHELATFQR